jgi:hypothetical protein
MKKRPNATKTINRQAPLHSIVQMPISEPVKNKKVDSSAESVGATPVENLKNNLKNKALSNNPTPEKSNSNSSALSAPPPREISYREASSTAKIDPLILPKSHKVKDTDIIFRIWRGKSSTNLGRLGHISLQIGTSYISYYPAEKSFYQYIRVPGEFIKDYESDCKKLGRNGYSRECDFTYSIRGLNNQQLYTMAELFT